MSAVTSSACLLLASCHCSCKPWLVCELRHHVDARASCCRLPWDVSAASC